MSNKYFGGVVENKGVKEPVDEELKSFVLGVPAKVCLLYTSVDFITALKGSVKVDSVHSGKKLNCFDVFFAVCSIFCMFRIGESTAVEVVDQSSCSLVSALACAVNSAYICLLYTSRCV